MLLLENVGGSEKNRLIIANVQSDDACTQPCSPLVSGFVDDALQDARPRVNEALLQVVGVADWRLVHALLHPSTSDPVVDRWFRSGLLGGHRSGEMIVVSPAVACELSREHGAPV